MAARRVDGLLIERTGGEMLVIRESSHEAHALNEAAAIVFDLCDGSMTIEAMAAEVARRTGLPADASVVDLALADLVEAGLVVRDEADAAPLITRRSLVRRLALPAAAMAMLPVVETVLMPTPAEGQSGPIPSPGPPPSGQQPSQGPSQAPSSGPAPMAGGAGAETSSATMPGGGKK